ncbi:theronine dehydrogenase [Rahnella rivi]|uniref:theronine dehydrogenase n=1 Tax=Rahnella rivi TaxID=2816249 RepID=UPI0039BEBFBE
MWRYSLRWRYPHIPCSGEPILVFEDVCEGAPVPVSILSRFIAGGDYAVSLDFLSERPIRRWPPERKAQARLRNLQRRILKNAPLFADELIARELARRPEYFSGK